MKNVLAPLRKNLKILILIIILLILEAYFTLKLPEYTANIVDIGIANANMDYIYSAGTTMITFTIIATILAILVSYFSNKLACEYSNDLRKIVFSKVLKFSNHELDDISKSSLIAITTNDISHIQMILGYILNVLIFAPIMAVGGIIKTFELGTNLFWLILEILIIILFFMFLLLRRIMPYLGKLQEITDNINRRTREIIIGMPVIKTFVRQDFEAKKFKAVNDDFKEVNNYTNRYILFLSPLLTLHLSIMIVGIIFFGADQIESGIIMTGDLLAFIQYASQIVSSILMVASLFTIIPEVMVSINRVKEILDTEVTIVDGEIDKIDAKKSTIEFKNVSYKYPKSEKDTITNINFKLEPGKTVAIIGSIGSGKSTILNLIPRLQDPSAGEILMNGENIRNFKLETLREKISLTPQKAHLFQGTVKSNMTIIDSDASDEKIKEALDKANVNFINGLDDEVYQDGSNFSGGQKQRLSIARSILKNADFYLFDDCFSALDMNTEKAIRDNLKEFKDSSILIVSQRISTIKDADEILVLDNGKIVDRGSHNKLVETSETYNEIVKSQTDTLGGGI